MTVRNIVLAFTACGALAVLFVLWTERAYQLGMAAAMEAECDVGSVN